MATCLKKVSDNNFLRLMKVSGSLTLAELEGGNWLLTDNKDFATDLSGWDNSAGSDEDWVWDSGNGGQARYTDIAVPGTDSERLEDLQTFNQEEEYTITYKLEAVGGGHDESKFETLFLENSVWVKRFDDALNGTSDNGKIVTHLYTPTVKATGIAFRINSVASGIGRIVDVGYFRVFHTVINTETGDIKFCE